MLELTAVLRGCIISREYIQRERRGAAAAPRPDLPAGQERHGSDPAMSDGWVSPSPPPIHTHLSHHVQWTQHTRPTRPPQTTTLPRTAGPRRGPLRRAKASGAQCRQRPALSKRSAWNGVTPRPAASRRGEWRAACRPVAGWPSTSQTRGQPGRPWGSCPSRAARSPRPNARRRRKRRRAWPVGRF